MAAESNVGARIFLIGKDAALAGLREVQAAVAKLNATVAAGADASASAAAADDEQAAAIARMNLAMDTYRANLAETELATDSLARVGKFAFYAIAGAAAAWTYESVKWAQQYQTALVQLQTQAGLTARAVRSISGAAMANAASLGVSPTAYVQAAYHPASAGFGVKTTESITNNALKLAAIGHSGSETTVNALTTVMRAYNLRGSAAKHTAALLNAIIGAGDMYASTLVGALRSGVASTAKTFGVSLSSMGSALAFMTDRGVPATQAGTHLRMTLSLLGAPSEEAATYLKAEGLTTARILSSTNSMSQMLQEAGVTSTQLSRALRTNKGKGGIYNALELLHRTMTAAGLTEQMQSAMISRSFGGGRMGSTIMMMYNTVAKLGGKDAKIQRTGSTSRFMKDWSKETGTLDFQLHRLESTIETLGTTFGTTLIPPLTKVVALFTDTLEWLDKNKWAAYALGTMVSAVLVPAMGLYLYRALFKTGGAIKTVLQGYANLIRGNTAEQGALKKAATQMTLTSDETTALAGRTNMLGGAADTTAGRIALETSVEDKNVAAADADAAAELRLADANDKGAAGSTAAGAAGTTAAGAAGTAAGRAASASAAAAAGATTMLGATTAGAAIALQPYARPIAKKLTGTPTSFSGWHELKMIPSAVESLWDDLFHDDSTKKQVPMPPIHVHAHVHLNNREIAKATTKVTRRDASLAGG